MSFSATVFKVLIASPGDVSQERDRLTSLIHKWNEMHSEAHNCVLMPVKWETHAIPEMGDRPQEIINRQIVRDADLLVAVFWTRLGTATGVAESGTAEEIEEFVKLGKPAMVYFSDAVVSPSKFDIKQYARLQKFRSKLQDKGLTHSYSSIDELASGVNVHLTAFARKQVDKSVPITVVPVEETAVSIIDRARDVAAAKHVANQRKEFLSSPRGAGVADGQVKVIFDQLTQVVNQVNAEALGIQVVIERTSSRLVIRSGGFSVVVSWEQTYSNTTDGALLKVTSWQGTVSQNPVWSEPRRLRQIAFEFDIQENSPGWKPKGAEGGVVAPAAVADQALGILLQLIEDDDGGTERPRRKLNFV